MQGNSSHKSLTLSWCHWSDSERWSVPKSKTRQEGTPSTPGSPSCRPLRSQTPRSWITGEGKGGGPEESRMEEGEVGVEAWRDIRVCKREGREERKWWSEDGWRWRDKSKRNKSTELITSQSTCYICVSAGVGSIKCVYKLLHCTFNNKRGYYWYFTSLCFFAAKLNTLKHWLYVIFNSWVIF